MLSLLLACTDTTMVGPDPAEECDPALTMDAPGVLERSPAELVASLESIYLTLYWGAVGPLTGSDPIGLHTAWDTAWGTCTEEVGVYVSGPTTVNSTSGVVDSTGVLTLFFPTEDTWEVRQQTEEALPIAVTSTLEAAAHEALGSGEILWLSLLLQGTDSVAIEGSVDDGESVTAGHVQEGVFAVSDPC